MKRSGSGVFDGEAVIDELAPSERVAVGVTDCDEVVLVVEAGVGVAVGVPVDVAVGVAAGVNEPVPESLEEHEGANERPVVKQHGHMMAALDAVGQ